MCLNFISADLRFLPSFILCLTHPDNEPGILTVSVVSFPRGALTGRHCSFQQSESLYDCHQHHMVSETGGTRVVSLAWIQSKWCPHHSTWASEVGVEIVILSMQKDADPWQLDVLMPIPPDTNLLAYNVWSSVYFHSFIRSYFYLSQDITLLIKYSKIWIKKVIGHTQENIHIGWTYLSIAHQWLFSLEGNNCHLVLLHICPEISYFHDAAIDSGIDKGMFQCRVKVPTF